MIISNQITLEKRRTNGDPNINKNESFGQLCQETRLQRIDDAMDDQQASGEANSFSLRHDEQELWWTILRTYSCNLERSVLINNLK